jgi:hypothetical protein
VDLGQENRKPGKPGTVGANVSLLLSPGYIRENHQTLSLKQKQAG